MADVINTVSAILNYLYPIAILVYYFVCCGIATATLQTLKAAEKAIPERPGRRVTVWVIAFYLLSYLAQLVVVAIHSISSRQWPATEHVIIRPLSCILVFGVQLSLLVSTEYPVWFPYYGSWFLAILFEVAIAALSNVPLRLAATDYAATAELVLGGLRCVDFLFLCTWFFVARYAAKREDAVDEEQQGLLGGQEQNGNTTGYGSADNKKPGEFRWERFDRQAREAMTSRLKEVGSWLQYAKGFLIFWPYIWPVGDRRLQAKIAGVIACLFASNVLNLLIPRQTGIIVDSLAGSSETSPWIAVIVFAFLRLADSESGVQLVKTWLWLPVQYFSRENMTKAAYSHILHLSADFHDSKSSSDMMMAISGGAAIANTIESILLEAAPMLVDMAVATVYLSITFGPYEGLVTVATGAIFLMITSQMLGESKEMSRSRRNALYTEWSTRSSGFEGWPTISAFNQIGYEDNRHADAVVTRWSREKIYMMKWYYGVAFQTVILTTGLLASAFVAVWRISDGRATSGQFTMLLMYWAQLTAPLKFFSRLGKNLSDDLTDAEMLLGVMRAQPSVENKKNARPIKFTAGKVVFDNVCFSYDKQKDVINKVSFEVPAGQTVAFVGATGAGKSTLLRLLDRFYDVTDGCIRIDGQDIREVDLFSLRDRIGVVPQAPILFDDTIMNNVRYGKITATDEEVYEACRAACFHDKIETFTEGYETRVGSRGVKLSGGELQRVAIARAILKQPDMVLLDEATSAVDTDTEHKIQMSFKRLCQGRTTFIVAHRLSTIMNADRIIVVEGGEIVEQGNHNELLQSKGRYADLWSKQTFLRAEDKSGINGAVVNDLSSDPNATDTLDVAETLVPDEEQAASANSDDGKETGDTQSNDGGDEEQANKGN